MSRRLGRLGRLARVAQVARLAQVAVIGALALASPAVARADDAGVAPAPVAPKAPGLFGEGVIPGVPGVHEHDVVEVQPGKKPIKALTVDNPYGDVRIEGHDGKGLRIYAYKHAPDHAGLDQLRVSLVPDPDGPVRITTAVDRAAERTALPETQVRIDLVIEAPRNARIDARVGRGALVVRDMDAGGDLDAGAGEITVENVSGAIYARSVDGHQRFSEVFGDLDAQALAANLLFDTVRGDELFATVHDGTIEAHRIASKHIELRATRGGIQLDGELQLGGKLLVATRRGDVDVRVHSAGAIQVKALAGADLELVGADTGAADRATRWVQARYGKGKRAAAVELRSKYGAVRFEVVE